MTRESVLRAFTPKYFSLFPVFEKNAGNLIMAAGALKLLMQTTDTEKQDEIIRKINEFEKKGDDITQETYALLNGMLIIPFDREDINDLVNRIDDLLDSINKISRMVLINKLMEPVPVYIEMAEIVHLASKEIGTCFRHFKDIGKSKKKIIEGCSTLNHLEKKSDEIFYDGVFSLFAGKGGMTQISIKKNILDNFMKCQEEIKLVAEAIRTIVIKAS